MKNETKQGHTPVTVRQARDLAVSLGHLKIRGVPSIVELYAAAPELLDHAVRSEAGAVDALAEVDAITGSGPGGDLEEVRAFLVSCRDEARAAIAKAEGVL